MKIFASVLVLAVSASAASAKTFQAEPFEVHESAREDMAAIDEQVTTDSLTTASTSSYASTTNVRVLVVGQGMAGSAAMYELTQKGIGNSSLLGASKAPGIMLVESSTSNKCGIIEPIDFAESSGVSGGPWLSSGAPNPNYKPYRSTVAAQRINIATMPAMRCLANELDMVIYYSPWATEYRTSGYRTYNGRFNCNRNYKAANGFEGGCRKACSAGNVGGSVWVGSGGDQCNTNFGSADLVKQSGKTPAFNLWNYNPSKNLNQGTNAPEDEWYGWALGYAGYFNPTYNYDGKGRAYNGASFLPYNANDPTQDHPRHTCGKFRDLYSMYQYYLGPEYAQYICEVNIGFHADCNYGLDACAYMAGADDGYTSWSYQSLDEGYPVGTMTEFCTRQMIKANKNTNGVKVSTLYSDPVVSLNKAAGSNVFVATTKAGNVIQADDVILAVPPSAIKSMAGNIPQQLTAQPQFDSPQAVSVVTFVMHWPSNSATSSWMSKLTADMFASYRMVNTGSCTNRLEFQNTPYHRSGAMHGVRVTYTDFRCIQNLLALARIDDPTLSKYNTVTGFPLQSTLTQEMLRELRQLFSGEGEYGIYNITSIPDPDFSVFTYIPNAWFWNKANSNYSMKQITKWATNPLATEPRLALAHQAWNMLFSGWSVSSVNQTREDMLALYPKQFSRAAYEARTVCNNKHSSTPWGNDWSVTYTDPYNPKDPAGLNQTMDAPTSYDTPGLNAQFDYASGMKNEHFPPYDANEQVQWIPRT